MFIVYIIYSCLCLVHASKKLYRSKSKKKKTNKKNMVKVIHDLSDLIQVS